MIYLQHMYVYEDNPSQLPTDRGSYPLKGEGLPSLLSGAPHNSDYQAKRHQKTPTPCGCYGPLQLGDPRAGRSATSTH